MRDTLIVEQLATGRRVTPVLETIIVSHWNASHSLNEATLLSVTGMRVADLMEHISVSHLEQDSLTGQIIAYADWDVNYLTFHESVHLNNAPIYIYPTRCNVTQFILSGNCSKCFRWYYHP
jgi:hypothetical protein